MLVILSTNRCVATSISFIERSRLTETRCEASLREHRSQHPIVMRALKQDLLARLGVDRANRVVGAAEGDPRAIGRPTDAVKRVVRHRDRQHELPGGDIPNLNFTQSGGRTAGHGQPFAVGRKRQRLHSFRQPDEPGFKLRAIGLPQQHLVIAGDGQQLAVGRIVERRDDWRQMVRRRMGRVERLRRGGRRVVDGPFGNPAADQCDLLGVQRALALRHFGLAFGRRNLRHEIAVVRLARHNRRRTAFAPFSNAANGAMT